VGFLLCGSAFVFARFAGELPAIATCAKGQTGAGNPGGLTHAHAHGERFTDGLFHTRGPFEQITYKKYMRCKNNATQNSACQEKYFGVN
jgi:hypothetical protein